MADIAGEPVATTQAPSGNCVLELNQKLILFFLFGLIPMGIFLLVLSMLQKRKKKLLSFLYGRPSIVIPVDFIGGRHRWLLAFTFVVITNYVFGNFIVIPPHLLNDPTWTEKFRWTTSLVNYLNYLLVGLAFYPLVACVSMRNNLIANVIGLLTTVYWTAVTFYSIIICSSSFNADRSGTSIDQNAFTIARGVALIPVLACEVFLIIVFSYDIVTKARKIWLSRGQGAHREFDDLVRGDIYPERERKLRQQFLKDINYVAFLIKGRKDDIDQKLKPLEKVKRYIALIRLPGFYYSPRVICTMVAAAVILYKVFVALTGAFELVFQLADQQISRSNQSSPLAKYFLEVTSTGRAIFNTASVVSTLVQVGLMIHMIITYRKHTRLILRGNHSWYCKREVAPMYTMACTFKYSGYQIAYILTGYFMLLILVFIFTSIIAFLIVLPLKYHQYEWTLIPVIKEYWPFLIISLIVYFGQILLARFFFCQEGNYLALDNIRAYHLAAYLLYFVNIPVGFISCIRRLIFSIFSGAILVSRMDCCLLNRHLERWDPGFEAYVGTLTVEVAHSHPVMKAFVWSLWDSYLKNQSLSVAGTSDELPKLPNVRVRNRWLKAYTLIRNKRLIYERIVQRAREDGTLTGLDALKEVLIEGSATAGATLVLSTIQGVAHMFDSVLA